MSSRPPEPPSTWLLVTLAAFLLILNVGMLCMLVAPPNVFEWVMGAMVLTVGAVLSWYIQPWQWFEGK